MRNSDSARITLRSALVLRLMLMLMFVAAGATRIAAQPMEGRLNQLSALWEKNRYVELSAILQRIPASGMLEDLRLYLLAESLRRSGKEQEALPVYRRLFQVFPNAWLSTSARFPYILLAARLEGFGAMSKLYPIAVALPTAYQRGRAVEALADLFPAGTPDRGKFLLDSLRQYRSNSYFYQEADDSRAVLKKLLDEARGFRFSRNEWLEIFLRACREGLGEISERVAPAIAPFLGQDGPAVSMLVQAESLRQRKQEAVALGVLDRLLSMRGIDPGLSALAHQIKGDVLHFAQRHSLAVAEFRFALIYNQSPVDVVAARYRLMRSAFEAGIDQDSVKAAELLCSESKEISLLPAHLYEMGLKRYDAGQTTRAVPFLMLMARTFPGNYRADDALGYATICLGLKTKDGSDVLQILERLYPHSFFLYWLDPSGRTKPLPVSGSKGNAVSASLKKRIPVWRVLLKSPFSKFAKDEIFSLLDKSPAEIANYRAAWEAAASVSDEFLVTALGERLLKATLESGNSSGKLPSWAWQALYPRPYWPKVQSEAKKYGIDPYWILSIMREESHFSPTILSRSNAHGLMQILPSTGKWIAEKLGIKGPFRKDSLWNTDRNIMFGSWYLAYLRDLFNGDLFLAAASYNGGQGNIQRKVEKGPFPGLPVLERLDRVPLPETRDYYKKVMGSWWNYRRFYGKQ